ncbi:TPA: hypothetical protein ACIYJA_004023 [Escherichia coli]
MDIDSVAEGVETQVQLNCLCSLGVDYLQGGGFRQAGKCGYILL